MASPDRVAPGVLRLRLPLPLALTHVNVFLVEGDRGWSIIDSGMHTAEGEKALRHGLAELGKTFADIPHAFITHYHPDHLGMAGLFSEAGSDVVMHEPELERARRIWGPESTFGKDLHAFFATHGMPQAVDDEIRRNQVQTQVRIVPFDDVRGVSDGGAVDLGGRNARAVWTPGHTDYHAVLVEEAEGLLYSGDHVLPRITSNISLMPLSRDDPLGDYLGALEKIAREPVRRVLPAHGEPFDDLQGRVGDLLAHHANRLDATVEAIESTARDAYEVMRILFTRLRSIHELRFALAETLAHLRHLERLGRVEVIRGTPIRWRAL